jgi:hypothetical protein
MRTVRAPITALSGKNISEYSLAISTATLAAPYAVLQRDSFDDPASSEPGSEGSRDGKPVDKAIAPDEATSVLGFLFLEWVLMTSFLMSKIGVAGVGGGLFISAAGDGVFLRRRCMVDERKLRCRRHLPCRRRGSGADELRAALK